MSSLQAGDPGSQRGDSAEDLGTRPMSEAGEGGSQLKQREQIHLSPRSEGI